MAQTSPETILKYSFLETPITALLSPGGRSEKVSSGELGPAEVAAFRQLLAQADPGVHEISVR